MGNERDEKTDEFLLKLSDKMEEADLGTYFNKYDIGKKCEFVDFETDEIVSELIHRGLLTPFGFTPIRLSTGGKRHVEHLRSEEILI